jgi:ribosomal-protein-alanine N-acetyltransferase
VAVGLATSRLRLTPLSSDDLEELVAMYADPEVMLGSSGAAVPRTREESQEWLDRTLLTTCVDIGHVTFRVDDRASGTFLGRCGLRPDADSPHTALAYAFVRTAWGQGIATEAARAVLDWGSAEGVTTVVGYVLAGNIASQRVLTKVGMVRTGERQTPTGALILYSTNLPGAR